MIDSKELVIKYFKGLYGETLQATDREDKNLCYDLLLYDRNVSIKVEYKSRYFNDETESFLKKNDILVELLQGLYYIKKGEKHNAKDLHTAIGWFYKTNCDRLVYIKYFNDLFYDLMDLNFFDFKSWIFNNIVGYPKLNWCGATTGTYNLIIPYKDIPKNIYKYSKA